MNSYYQENEVQLMQTSIKRYGNGKAHLKCNICVYEVYQDSVWYIKNYNDDTDGWFTCLLYVVMKI